MSILEKKRVILLTTAFGKGGAEKQLFKLAKYLDENKFSVMIISMLKLNMFEAELNETTIQFVSLNMDNSKLNIFKILKIITTFKPNVVISFLYTANILGRLIKLFYQYPLITSVRSGTLGSKFRSLLFKFTMAADNATVVNSFSVMQSLKAQRLVNSNLTINISNIIKVSNFTEYEKLRIKKALRAELNIQYDEFVFLFVGHYRPEKDYESLFQAVFKSRIKFKLVMIGNLLGHDWPAKRIDELALSSKILLLGKRDDVERFYMMADALVLTSISEGLPNAIMEALSFGLPVVATRVGGVLDLVEDGRNGLLCNPADTQSIVCALKKMVGFTDSERKFMGNNGIDKINKEFAENIITNKWHNVISKII